MADKLIAVKMKAEGGKVIKAEFADIGRAGGDAFRQLDRGSRSASGGLQSIGFQVQDFAVQVAGGTDASRALAQQLPQLLSGFGLMGVALGTLAAVGVPLASWMFGFGEASSVTSQKIDDLDRAIQAVRATSAAFTDGNLEKMRAKYGEINAQLLMMTERQRGIAIHDAFEKANDAMSGLRDHFSGFRRDLAALQDMESLAGSMTGDRLRYQNEMIAETRAAIIENYGLDIEQLNEVMALFDQMAAAAKDSDPKAAADTLARILDLLDQSTTKYDENYKNVAKAQDAMTQLNAALEQSLPTLSQMVVKAGDFFANLAAAASVRITAAAGDPLAPPKGAVKPKSKPGGLEFEVSETGGYRLPPPSKGGAGRSRGGGGGGVDPALREAQRLFDSTRTAAERYEVELAKIEDLHKRFPNLITDDVQSRAIDDLAKKFGLVDSAAKDAASAVRSAFDGIFDDPKRALEDLSKQLMQMLLYQQLGSWFPSIFGGGGIIPLAGARAGGGPVGGGLSYLVGERGPEIFTPSRSGVITPNHRIGGGGAAAPVVNVINNGPGTARAERSRGPDGEEIVNVIIEEGIARGRQDRALAGRTGLRPQAVRR